MVSVSFMQGKHKSVCLVCVCVCVNLCLCLCSYPLAISQVDLPKGGVKLRRWLTLVVLIQEDGRTADLEAQLLCALRDVEIRG